MRYIVSKQTYIDILIIELGFTPKEAEVQWREHYIKQWGKTPEEHAAETVDWENFFDMKSKNTFDK